MYQIKYPFTHGPVVLEHIRIIVYSLCQNNFSLFPLAHVELTNAFFNLTIKTINKQNRPVLIFLIKKINILCLLIL